MPKTRAKQIPTRGKVDFTYSVINGKRFPNQYRNEAGKIVPNAPGTYVDQFGATRKLPKRKKAK